MLGPEIQAPRYPTNRRLGGWKILVSTLYQDLPIYVVKRLLQTDVGFIGQEATVKCALLTTPCTVDLPIFMSAQRRLSTPHLRLGFARQTSPTFSSFLQPTPKYGVHYQDEALRRVIRCLDLQQLLRCPRKETKVRPNPG
jgi:hypothetical protein